MVKQRKSNFVFSIIAIVFASIALLSFVIFFMTPNGSQLLADLAGKRTADIENAAEAVLTSIILVIVDFLFLGVGIICGGLTSTGLAIAGIALSKENISLKPRVSKILSIIALSMNGVIVIMFLLKTLIGG